MKFNKFFMGLLGTLALSACSSDEPAGNSPGAPDVNEGDSYVTVSIEMPTAAGSRAADNGYDNYEDGTENESAVSNIVFFFFNDDDNCVDVQKIDNSEFKKPENPSENPFIEKYATVEVRLRAGLNYKKVAAALNSSANDANELNRDVKTVADLMSRNKNYLLNISSRKLDNGATDANFGKGQMMSNSVYYETGSTTGIPTEGNKAVLVPITEDNIYTADEKKYLGATTGDIQKKYVEIYVERVVARIDVSAPKFAVDNNGFVTDDNYYVSQEGDKKVKTILLYNHSNLSETEVTIKPEIRGIRLNVLTQSVNLIKPITPNPFDGAYTYAQGTPEPYKAFRWNDPLNKRSYWATTGFANLEYYSWDDTEGQSTSGFKEYINPNTFDYAPTYANNVYSNDGASRNTKVMVVAVLHAYDKDGNEVGVKTEGQGIDLVRLGSDYMFADNLLVHAATHANEAVRNIDWAQLTLNGEAITAQQKKDVEIVVSHAFETGLTPAMFKLDIKEITADNKFGAEDWEASVLQNNVTYSLDDVTATVDGVDVTTSLSDDLKAAVKAKIDSEIQAQLDKINEPDILYWKDGKTYFYYTIRHQGFYGLTGASDAKDAQDFLFGVVRNHIYKVDLNGLFGLGTPVIKPGKPINPDRPGDIPPSFISAKINVLPWRLVKNSATIH